MKDENLHIRISSDMKEDLKLAAKHHNCTMSTLAAEAIDLYIEYLATGDIDIYEG